MTDILLLTHGPMVYVSGPMTGRPAFNYPLFHAAKAALKRMGAMVVSPADSVKDPDATPREEFLRDDLKLILTGPVVFDQSTGNHQMRAVDALVFLPEWEQSQGARIEALAAYAVGCKFYALHFEPVGEGDDLELTNVSMVEMNRDDVRWTAVMAEHTKLAVENLGPPLAEAMPSAGVVEETTLEEANRLVHGPRNKDYGHPLDNFNHTADLFTAHLRAKLREGERFTADEVWQLMVLVKLSRERHAPKRDNRVDIGGYAETGQMVHDERVRRAALPTS